MPQFLVEKVTRTVVTHLIEAPTKSDAHTYWYARLPGVKLVRVVEIDETDDIQVREFEEETK